MNPNKLLLAIAITGWITITAHAQSFLTNGLVAFYPFKGNANDVVGRNGTMLNINNTRPFRPFGVVFKNI